MIWGSEKFHTGSAHLSTNRMHLVLSTRPLVSGWFIYECSLKTHLWMAVHMLSASHKHGALISVGLASIWCTYSIFTYFFKIPFMVIISFLSSRFFLIHKLYRKRSFIHHTVYLLHGTLRIRYKFPESFIILEINSEINIPPPFYFGGIKTTQDAVRLWCQQFFTRISI